MTIHKNVTELIGHTPLVELTNYERAHELPATLIGKVESFNPTGSVKDRAAQSMIDAAVEAGVLDDETVIIEPTSGNTGIGLSAIAAVRGNRIIIVMPETMSVERRNLMRAFGAELVLTEGAKGMKGAIEEAERLAAEIPSSFIPSQFSNPAVHERTTGPEIWEDTDGAVDILVAGVGTGGTLSGTGAYLKAQNPAIQVVAVEPAGSPVLSEGRAGAHKIQGIGAGFVPETLDTAIYDEVIAIEDEEAFEAGRELAAHDGLLVGISSGAAVAPTRKRGQEHRRHPARHGRALPFHRHVRFLVSLPRFSFVTNSWAHRQLRGRWATAVVAYGKHLFGRQKKAAHGNLGALHISRFSPARHRRRSRSYARRLFRLPCRWRRGGGLRQRGLPAHLRLR